MSHEDNGAAKGAQDAEKIAGEFDAAGKHNAQGERNEGEIGGCRVTDIVNEAVGENGEKWRKSFDGVDQGDGDFLNCR